MTTYGLHAHDLDPGRVTGIARYALGLAAALQDQLAPDERTTLVTARGSGTATTDHTVIDRNRRYLHARWLALRTPRIERLVPEIDLLHVTAPIVPTPTRRPLVVTIHDITPLTHPDWYTARDTFQFRQTITWTKRHAQAVIVPTQFVADQVCTTIGLDPSLVTVTGEGFDVRHFASDDPDGVLDRLRLTKDPYLLYLGALSTRKNLTPVIEALPESGPVLVLAGPDGHGVQQVREAAARRPGRVRLVGPLADAEIGPLVQGARALLHPSLFEGFGLTVLEAMSVGTPVIVSSCGALPEVVADGGLQVRSNDTSGWTEALAVVEDPAARAALRTAGLARSQHYSWAAAAQLTIEVYRRVLSR
jgi:glycosyltransferase involved in cell wall biosynthesis